MEDVTAAPFLQPSYAYVACHLYPLIVVHMLTDIHMTILFS